MKIFKDDATLKMKFQGIVTLLLTALYMPSFFLLALILFYLSKLIRALAYWLMLTKPNSAKEQLKDFWKINQSAPGYFN